MYNNKEIAMNYFPFMEPAACFYQPWGPVFYTLYVPEIPHENQKESEEITGKKSRCSPPEKAKQSIILGEMQENSHQEEINEGLVGEK